MYFENVNARFIIIVLLAIAAILVTCSEANQAVDSTLCRTYIIYMHTIATCTSTTERLNELYSTAYSIYNAIHIAINNKLRNNFKFKRKCPLMESTLLSYIIIAS